MELLNISDAAIDQFIEKLSDRMALKVAKVLGQTVETEKTLSREEYAKLIGVTPDTVTRMCNEGKLKFKMVGRRYRIYVNQNN